MEQDLCIDVGKFDPSEVDLTKPADTVQEYIKQVIVTRDNLPDVSVAKDVDRSKFKKPICLVPTDASVSAVCSFTPSTQWSQLKADNFSVMRTVFEEKRDQETPSSSTDFKFPGVNDIQGWIAFCLASRSQALHESVAQDFSYHKGTPPTLSLILSIPDNTVNFAILHLTNHFVENGYSRSLAEWIFALLLAVKKPLIHDVCNSLRQLARFCRVERAKLGSDQMEMIREYTLFIAIISLYFGQRDLMDR